jgi:Domain of unknown function (DUF4386)
MTTTTIKTDTSTPVENSDSAVSKTRPDKVNSIITGCFFITATVFAILGLILYDPLLATTKYLQHGASYSHQIVSGAVAEMIVVIANCGTAIMLYPYLKVYNQRLALGYYTFRVFECICILIGLVGVLSLLTLSETYASGSISGNSSYYYAIGTIAKAFHDWTFILGPKFFLGINTFIYSYVFYRTQLVPRNLALLGMTGAVMVFINSIFTLFGEIGMLSTVDIVTVFPIAIYEMILAGWLIFSGFKIEYRKESSKMI